MKKIKPIACLVFFVCASFVCTNAYAQNADKKPALTVTGEVTKPLRLDSADIVKINGVSASVKERDGVTRTYTGVPVTEILKAIITYFDQRFLN